MESKVNVKEVIGRIASGSGEIRVLRVEAYGKEYIDVRKYFLGAAAGEDKFLPTKKGIFIPVDKVKEVVQLLQQLQ